jgi:hypothetical protein
MWVIPGWAIGVAVIIMAVSIGKTVQRLFQVPADRIGGRSPTEPELERQREALEDVQRRLGELEERLDFTERLLAKQRGGERLGPPHS